MKRGRAGVAVTVLSAICAALALVIAHAGAQDTVYADFPRVMVHDDHLTFVDEAVFSDDGETLAVGHGDGRVRLWNWREGRILKRLDVTDKPVTNLAYVPGTRWLAIVPFTQLTKPTQLILVDPATEEKVSFPIGWPPRLMVPDHGRFAAVLGDNAALTFFDIATLQPRLFSTTVDVSQEAMSADGSVLVGRTNWAELDKISVIDVETGAIIDEFRIGTDFDALEVSPDGGVIAVTFTAAKKDGLELWDRKNKRLMSSLPGDQLWGSRFSPDGKLLATRSDDFIELWSVETGEKIARLVGHTANVTSISFSRDGAYLASSADDGTARVWSVEKGEEIVALYGVTYEALPLAGAAVLPDGRFASSAEIFPRHMQVSDNGTDMREMTKPEFDEWRSAEGFDAIAGK